MKQIDKNRRKSIKSITALSTLAVFGDNLFAKSIDKSETLVLLSKSDFSDSFIKGVNKVNSHKNHIKKIDLVNDYTDFDELIKDYSTKHSNKKIIGLLTQADFIIFNEKLKKTNIKLKAEIEHNISFNGTTHNLSVINSASHIISNSKIILEKDNNWASSTGFILNSYNKDNILSFLQKNEFNEATIKKFQKGDASLVSFLAT